MVANSVDLNSWFVVRIQLGPSIWSGSSPYAGIQVAGYNKLTF